ncbi:MAG: polysaccharide deacetylase family protein [Pseudomonadota bacterium]
MTNLRKITKKTLGKVVRCLPNIVKRKFIKGLTIFVYHEVSDRPSKFAELHGLAVSLQSFRKQIQWIKSNFEVIHPRDLLSGDNLPKEGALISFDDGFLGSFENGLTILEEMEVPSIHFLNMQAILEQKPVLSATTCFLEENVPDFLEFTKDFNIQHPFHLTLTPSDLGAFEEKYGIIDNKAVLEYQGNFADLNEIKKWENKNLVTFGNHLYDHWNVAALTHDELEKQYKKNESALSQFKNSINFFAFTNGQPGSCFSASDVTFLEHLGAEKVFSASGGVNIDTSEFLLRRMSLYEWDEDEDYIWFQLGRTMLSDLLSKASM